MKKTQVALAALALVASSAALADGVKVSGCVDATLVNTSSGTVLGGAGDGCASQMGFYGSADAGGLKTGFNLETGFSTANGAMGNGGRIASSVSATSAQSVFNRLANVYVGNDMATVKIGLQKSPWIEAAGGGLTAYGMNGVGVPALAIINPALSGTTQAGGFFVANGASVQFNAGGINGNVMTVINSASATNDSYTAGRLSTAVGALSLNVGYENRKNIGYLTDDVNYSNTVVSGAMDLGGGIGLNAAWARQSAAAANAAASGASQNGYVLGASYKMSDAIGFGLTYANNNQATKQSMTALSAQYNLSPATALYANLIDYTAATVLNNGGNAESGAYTGKLYAVGVHHAF